MPPSSRGRSSFTVYRFRLRPTTCRTFKDRYPSAPSSSKSTSSSPPSQPRKPGERPTFHQPKDTTKWAKVFEEREQLRKTFAEMSNEELLGLTGPYARKLPLTERIRQKFLQFAPQFLKDRPGLRSWLFTVIVGAPILGFLMLHFPWEPMSVNGGSMSPTLNPNYSHKSSSTEEIYDADDRDCLLVQRWSPNDWRLRMWARRNRREFEKYKRGQIIVFYTPHEPEKVAVKRIIGIPGDRVVPLDGYPGKHGVAGPEDKEGVVIPYNHLWVEGDVNDRSKSLDSNWYGPISQNLVIGEVKGLWRPWWKFWSAISINWSTQKNWPAQVMGRVEEGVVIDATINPDVISTNKAWTNGKNEKVLMLMKEKPEFVTKNFQSSEKQRNAYRQLYFESALMVAGSEEHKRRQLAAEMVRTMENLFGKAALQEGRVVIKDENPKKRERWTPPKKQDRNTDNTTIQEDVHNPIYFSDANVHDEEGRKRREEKLRPAQAALKKMKEQNRALADQTDREMEERDRFREVKEGATSRWVPSGFLAHEQKSDSNGHD